MEKNKLISEMYGILLLLEQEFDKLGIKEDFEEYAKKKTLTLFKEAFKWCLEDKREKEQKIVEEIESLI